MLPSFHGILACNFKHLTNVSAVVVLIKVVNVVLDVDVDVDFTYEFTCA